MDKDSDLKKRGQGKCVANSQRKAAFRESNINILYRSYLSCSRQEV